MKTFISTLSIGISKAQMYSGGHEAVGRNGERLASILDELPDDDLKMMVVENELVFNGVLHRDAGLHADKLIKMLNAKGLSRVDFLKGVTAGEAADFMVDVADAEGELGTYPHIQPGVLRVRVSSAVMPSDLELGPFLDAQLDRVENIYKGISPFRELEMAGLEEIVANFLLTFRRGVNILQMISPVRSHSEYTYTHAMNVAVLSISLAEVMGLDDDTVLEIGVAAMMHDVGKLFVSKRTLHKAGQLTSEEFEHVKQHSLLGAAYLAKIEGMPRIASVVALEHHLRYDGNGYPVQQRSGGRQHTASQIVSIADVFDALRSCRPYRRDLAAEEVLRMLKKGEGTAFHPELLKGFTVIVGSAL